MLRYLKIVVFLIAATGLAKVEFSSDPARFHRPSPVMLRGEAAVASATGAAATGFRLVPLAEWQRENFELKSKMPESRSGEPSFLSAADLPEMMRLEVDGVDYVMLPSDAPDALRPKEVLTERFSALLTESYRLFAISMALMAIVLLIAFRRRFFAYALPIFAAVLATAGTLGWLGEPLTCFSVLCFFLLSGLGVDYVIFHRASGVRCAGAPGLEGVRLRCVGGLGQEGSENSTKPSSPNPLAKRTPKPPAKRTPDATIVFASFLTSLIGFGMLAFTSFEVTRSIGLTLAIGLFFAYFFSLRRS